MSVFLRPARYAEGASERQEPMYYRHLRGNSQVEGRRTWQFLRPKAGKSGSVGDRDRLAGCVPAIPSARSVSPRPWAVAGNPWKGTMIPSFCWRTGTDFRPPFLMRMEDRNKTIVKYGTKRTSLPISPDTYKLYRRGSRCPRPIIPAQYFSPTLPLVQALYRVLAMDRRSACAMRFPHLSRRMIPPPRTT